MIDDFDEFIRMLDLGAFSEAELADMKTNELDYKKAFGKFQKKTRQASKKENCFYCGASCSSFCNSHSVPAFCLRNIAEGGVVFLPNQFIKMPLFNFDGGVNNSGTFQLLCNSCDSKIFSDYENPDNYNNTPTIKMLAQVAMKNYLKHISKRYFEEKLYQGMFDEFGMPNSLYEHRQHIIDIDLKEYINGYNYARKAAVKCFDDEYYLFFYTKLDYVVPVAFQSAITLISDFEGNVINDIYSLSFEKPTKDLHICIFPLQNQSVVMMFINSHDKIYRPFYKQFKRLSFELKLATVAYIMFLYSEDIFIFKGLNESVLNNKKLIEICRRSIDMTAAILVENPVKYATKYFDISKAYEIPNILSEKYKVR